MSTPDALTKELHSLRVLRASLTSLHQLLEAVHKDVAVQTPANYAAVTAVERRWKGVLEDERQEDKGAE